MSEPLKCCPHCDAEQEFSRMQGELTPCWLCRKPLSPDRAQTRRTLPTPKPRPAPLLERIVRTTFITLLVIIGIPISAVVSAFAVCSAVGVGALGLSWLGRLFSF